MPSPCLALLPAYRPLPHSLTALPPCRSEFEIDFVTLSYCRSAEDVREARNFLSSIGREGVKVPCTGQILGGVLWYSFGTVGGAPLLHVPLSPLFGLPAVLASWQVPRTMGCCVLRVEVLDGFLLAGPLHSYEHMRCQNAEQAPSPRLGHFLRQCQPLGCSSTGQETG